MIRPSLIASALKRIGGTGREVRLPKLGAADATTIECLYIPCVRTRRNGHSVETHRWVQEVPIVKKTAKTI